MNVAPKLLAAAILAALSSPAFAEIEFDVIGGSEISFEGLVQADFYKYNRDVAFLGSTGGTTAGDGVDTDFGMRRAELIFKGKGPGQWNWVLGYDARADKFLDANISYKFSGFTVLKVGQYKQPNSLEELSSTKNNDFISKAMTTNLQGVARRFGASMTTGADQWSLTGSVFTRELTRNLGQGNGYGVRGTWAPILDTGSLLHLGVSLVDYEARDAGSAVGATPAFDGDNRARFRVRPDADLTGTRLVDSGQFTDADRIRTLGLEGAWVHGPVKVQAEMMKTDVGRTAHQDYSFDSFYVSGLWNLTGETWGYKDAVITTGLPNEPASGMWQLGVRYDKVDLNDGTFTAPSTVTGVLGGKESNWTVGVNWYWRSNFKVALNYVKVSSERYNSSSKLFVEDNPSIIEVRTQLYW
ncbi:MAG: OprO/OprP family phosphate-selective porin [Gammaproteobacteria bacterium]|nr:OprO/OprP family phosphate-selective porin [Gammaproteobacteria bacterium]